jgi:hypothetical protein
LAHSPSVDLYAPAYNHARAITPLLDNPLEGPVYLRSQRANNAQSRESQLNAFDRNDVEIDVISDVASTTGHTSAAAPAAKPGPQKRDLIAGLVVTATAELGEKIRFYQNAAGAILGPFDSWLVIRGMETLTLRNNATGEEKTVPAKALFVYIGTKPGTDWLNSVPVAGPMSAGRKYSLRSPQAAARCGSTTCSAWRS